MKYTSLLSSIITSRLLENEVRANAQYPFDGIDTLRKVLGPSEINPEFLPYILPLTEMMVRPKPDQFIIISDRGGKDPITSIDRIERILNGRLENQIYIMQNVRDRNIISQLIQRGYERAGYRDYFNQECIDLSAALTGIFDTAAVNPYEANEYSAWFDPKKKNLFIAVPSGPYSIGQMDCSSAGTVALRLTLFINFIFSEQICTSPEQVTLIEKTFEIIIDKTLSEGARKNLLIENAKEYTQSFQTGSEEYTRLFNQATEAMQEQYRASFQRKIEEIEAKYHQQYDSLCHTLDERNKLLLQQGQALSQTFSFDEFMRILEKYPAVDDFAIYNTELHLRVTTPITFDYDLFKMIRASKPRIGELIQHIVDNKVTMYFQQELYFDITSKNYELRVARNANNNAQCNTPADVPVNMNPHLNDFGCFGTHRAYFTEAVENGNFHAMIQIMISAVSQINLADGAVMSSFANRQWYIVRNSDGKHMRFNDYLREEQENAQNVDNEQDQEN